jgi:hypothetical protein
LKREKTPKIHVCGHDSAILRAFFVPRVGVSRCLLVNETYRGVDRILFVGFHKNYTSGIIKWELMYIFNPNRSLSVEVKEGQRYLEYIATYR